MKEIKPIFFLFLAAFWACQSEQREELSTFQIHPDFSIERVAAEPLVFDPVDLEFDHLGNAYVLEMPGYPFGDEESRIVQLEDKDHDGTFDHRTIFSDSLGVATSLLPYKEGWLVAAPPDLLYIKDTDADGKADQRIVVLTGFSEGNLQHNVNGLTYGLDNWIYMANGGNSGSVYWPDQDKKPIQLRGNDFRMHLEEKQFELIGESSGGFELGINSWGHIFETHNLDHISYLAFPGRYIKDLPISSHSLANISGHDQNGLARIFPIGAQESRVNHPEQAGYFSGACGITHYGGGTFPNEFEGNIFVADVVLNLIHRDIITPNGAIFTASRGREKVEFLASSDRSFRPVNMTVGPDGALYILDMHRKVIEHPEWIPDEIEKDLDLEAGKDKGRIYRITPNNSDLSISSKFNWDEPQDIVAALGHSNQWWRTTAQRYLVEAKSETVVPELKDLFNRSNTAIARLHALWTLQGLEAMDEAILINALKDNHSGIRENALIISENGWFKNPEILNVIIALSSDPDPRVRMQTALTLGRIIRQPGISSDATHKAQLEIAEKDIDDPWTRLALLSSVQSESLAMIQSLLSSNAVTSSNHAGEMLRPLALLVGASGSEEKIGMVLETLEGRFEPEPTLVVNVLEGLSLGWERSTDQTKTGTSLAALEKLEQSLSVPVITAALKFRKALGLAPAKNLTNVLKSARSIVANTSLELQKRIEHLSLLEFESFEDRELMLYDLLRTTEPEPLQMAAMSQLKQARAPSIAPRLIQLWPTLGPKARMAAGDILLYQDKNHDLLLTALEDGAIQLGEMNLHLERRRKLLFSNKATIKSRAEALFSDAGIVKRKEALAQMRPALTLKGNVNPGKATFEKLCASCHRLGDQGQDVGPDLTDVFNRSSAALLQDILDPNAAVDTKYINHIIVTKDGITHSGIAASETGRQVTLKTIGGMETTVGRNQIESFTATGLSIMPEGLEASMSHQEMADLLAYLQEYR